MQPRDAALKGLALLFTPSAFLAAEIFTLVGALGLTFAQGNSNICESDYSINLITPVMDNLEPLLEVYWGPLAQDCSSYLHIKTGILAGFHIQDQKRMRNNDSVIHTSSL